MSLNWSTQKVKHFTENPDDLWVKYSKGTPEEYQDLNAETKSLIFGTMTVCLNSIQESNIAEWYARWKVYEKYHDYSMYTMLIEGEIVKTYMTPDALIKHIGLSTNAYTYSTTEWAKSFVKNWYKNDGICPTTTELKALVTVYKMEFNESQIKEKEKVS